MDNAEALAVTVDSPIHAVGDEMHDIVAAHQLSAINHGNVTPVPRSVGPVH